MRKLSFILSLLLLLSCQEPRSTEQFIRGEGPFAFTVDMSDSTVCYDFDLFTRINAAESPSSLRLDMRWTAPCDSVFTETVYLPVERGHSVFAMDTYAPYRADVRPFQWGTWQLEIAVPHRPKGFRGMGLVVRKK